jgi:hypothetical protein
MVLSRILPNLTNFKIYTSIVVLQNSAIVYFLRVTRRWPVWAETCE